MRTPCLQLVGVYRSFRRYNSIKLRTLLFVRLIGVQARVSVGACAQLACSICCACFGSRAIEKMACMFTAAAAAIVVFRYSFERSSVT